MTEQPTRLRVVIDSDAANEIDDQFAIAWALRSQERLEIEGLHAAPFSHGRYFEALGEASRRRGHPSSDFDRIACAISETDLAALLERTSPEEGMQRSHAEIHRVAEAAGAPSRLPILRGATDFLPAPDRPVPSEATEHLIHLARSARPEEPIHVAIIGAPTNVASALLIDPSIAPNLRLVFLAGYPSGAGLDDDSFNLVQDRFASNVLFESAAPMLYIPGYHVAETLQLSLPAARDWLAQGGRLARFLFETYCANPINPRLEAPGRSWVLWDIIAVAALLDSSWVPDREVSRPRIDAEHRWEVDPGESRTMREAYHVKRNDVLEDLMAKVAGDANSSGAPDGTAG